MTKEEQLQKEYQRSRRKLEEQEDEIKKYERQGQQLAEETYSEIRYLVSSIAENSEPLEMARTEISRLEEEFRDNLEKEKKKVIYEQEELEQQYRKQLKEIKEGE